MCILSLEKHYWRVPAVSFSSNIDQNLSDPSTRESIFVLLLLAAVVESAADVEVAGEEWVVAAVVGAVIVVGQCKSTKVPTSTNVEILLHLSPKKLFSL